MKVQVAYKNQIDDVGQAIDQIDASIMAEGHLEKLRIKWTSSEIIGGKFMSLVKFYNGDSIVAEALLSN